MANVCPAVGGCSNQIDMIFPPCDYCKRKHCTKHRIPESHGCRDAIRAAAQQQAHTDAREIKHERKTQERNNSDAKKAFDAKRAELAKKRQKK